MKEQGTAVAVIVVIIVATVAIVGGYYLLVKGELPGAGGVTLRELIHDFDNSTYKFRSYDSGDIIQIQDTVENVILVTRDELNENIANLLETAYEISFPMTLVLMESVENLIWGSHLAGFEVIGLEGDRHGEYEIGQEVTISIHIEKALGMEIAREPFIGTMLWFQIRPRLFFFGTSTLSDNTLYFTPELLSPDPFTFNWEWSVWSDGTVVIDWTAETMDMEVGVPITLSSDAGAVSVGDELRIRVSGNVLAITIQATA